MYGLRKGRRFRTISVLVALSMLLSLVPVSVAGAAGSGAKPVLVFPVLDESQSGVRGVSDDATAALHMAIDAQAEFAASKFSAHSPLVRRAVSEGRLRQVDVDAGETASQSLALFIGKVIGAEYVVISSVQSLDIQEAPRQVKVILSGRAYEVEGNVDEATDEAVQEPTVYRAFGVAGTSQPRANYTGSDAPLVAEALRDAAYKAAKTLAGKPTTEEKPTRREPSKSWKWLLYALGVGVLMIAVNNSDSPSAGAGPAALAKPVTNLSLQELQTNIRLTWDQPTGTTLQVLYYEVWRQIDGGGFSKLYSVAAGQTEYTDTETLDGRHAYQYRVRVLYTNSAASEYKYSGNLWFTRT